MLAAVTRLQGPYTVALYLPEDGPDCWELARNHFGSRTEIRTSASAQLSVRAVAEGDAALAVLPMPEAEPGEPWWRYILGHDSPRVIARLPFAARPVGRDSEVDAYVLGHVPIEATGDDRSLLVLEIVGDISRARLGDLLGRAHLDASHVSLWRDPSGSLTYYLLDAAGHVTAADERIAGLIAAADEMIVHVCEIGGYARPFDPKELANAETTA